jgi:4-alpha-glucanotransferase
MPARISLGLVIHNHQPVGNFGWVIEEVFERAYLPMVDALERHPGVRVGLHYSGPLIEWLRVERPGFLDRVAALAARGQVELLGGGWYEPILASLPARDRAWQLDRMADQIQGAFGSRPGGAWLAERVWEPDLPIALADAGYRWTILDDAHFRAAAVPEDALWGAYTTEDQGRLLTVFGTEQGLRYRIPFRDVEDVIAYLRDNATDAGDRIGIMGDDGEKFGAWPTTWELCWGRGAWVERFFAALDANREWLTTVTPSAWLEQRAPIGRVYLPTSSYAEMGEWVLPTDEGLAYAAAVRAAQADGRPEARWLRGGFWRNFQVRYREINDLHKQMLRVSDKVARLPDGPERDRAREELGRGQSNDVYWHGLFGGIYLSHLRLATLAHLIAAEDEADRALGGSTDGRLADLDLDGRDEVVLADDGQLVTVDLDEGGGIGSWDIRAARHAVTAILRRRPEAYHARLDEAPAADTGSADTGGHASSIHDLVQAKEKDLGGRLRLDPYERRSGLVRFLAPGTTPEAWADGEADELGDAVDGSFAVEELGRGRLRIARAAHVAGGAADAADAEVGVTKTVRLAGERLRPLLALDVDVENRSDRTIAARIGIEWSTTMLGGGGNPAAWWEVAGDRGPHDGAGTASAVRELAQGNDDLGLRIRTSLEPPLDAWWAPIETISNSEAGFERVYQGSGLLLSTVLELAPGERTRLAIEQMAEVRGDRATAVAAAGDPGRR